MAFADAPLNGDIDPNEDELMANRNGLDKAVADSYCDGTNHMTVDPQTKKSEVVGPCDDPKHQVIQAAQAAVQQMQGQPEQPIQIPLDSEQ